MTHRDYYSRQHLNDYQSGDYQKEWQAGNIIAFLLFLTFICWVVWWCLELPCGYGVIAQPQIPQIRPESSLVKGEQALTPDDRRKIREARELLGGLTV
jgi:hypothetical protein